MRGPLSPDGGSDPGPKRTILAREGMAHPRFADPGARTPEAFGPHDGKRLLPETPQNDDPVSPLPSGATGSSPGDP